MSIIVIETEKLFPAILLIAHNSNSLQDRDLRARFHFISSVLCSLNFYFVSFFLNVLT